MENIIGKLKDGELVYLNECINELGENTGDTESIGDVWLGVINGKFDNVTDVLLPDGKEELMSVIDINYELFGYKYGFDKMEKYKPYVEVFRKIKQMLN